MSNKNEEKKRLEDAQKQNIPWKKWGPYLSERQWGTVREDYSESGTAWDYFTHDQARSRAYHWGEDGRRISCYVSGINHGLIWRKLQLEGSRLVFC